MQKKLFLHIGHQKCGSTTIQHWLTDYQDALREIGVHYIKAGRRKSYVHHRLALQVLNSHLQNDDNNLFREVRQEINNSTSSNFIISAENFIQIDDSSQLIDLRRHLPQDIEIHLVLIFRNQYKWLNSQWAQLAKNGTTLDSYKDWFSQNFDSLRALKYDQICEFWLENFQPSVLHILSLDDLVGSFESLIAGFFKSLNLPCLPADVMADTQRYNISPTYQTILLCKEIFTQFKQQEELSFLFEEHSIAKRERVSNLIQYFAQMRGLNSEKKKWSTFSQDQQVFEYYYKSNLKFTEWFSSQEKFEIFLKPPTPSNFETDDVETQPTISASLLNEALIFMLARLIKTSTDAGLLYQSVATTQKDLVQY